MDYQLTIIAKAVTDTKERIERLANASGANRDKATHEGQLIEAQLRGVRRTAAAIADELTDTPEEAREFLRECGYGAAVAMRHDRPTVVFTD
jgi:hypothetical protein